MLSLSTSLASSFTTLLVHGLLHLLLLRVSLVLDLLVTLLDPLGASHTALLFLLGVLLIQVCKALNHRMNLLLLLVHESFLEGALGRQRKFREQIALSTLILLSHVVEDGHSLLLFEGQVSLNPLRHSEACEDALVSSLIDNFIVVCILRVLLPWQRQASLPPELAVRFEHASLAIGDNRVAEAWYIYTIPSTAENDITHQNLVFERRSEGTVSCRILHNTLDTATNT